MFVMSANSFLLTLDMVRSKCILYLIYSFFSLTLQSSAGWGNPLPSFQGWYLASPIAAQLKFHSPSPIRNLNNEPAEIYSYGPVCMDLTRDTAPSQVFPYPYEIFYVSQIVRPEQSQVDYAGIEEFVEPDYPVNSQGEEGTVNVQDQISDEGPTTSDQIENDEFNVGNNEENSEYPSSEELAQNINHEYLHRNHNYDLSYLEWQGSSPEFHSESETSSVALAMAHSHLVMESEPEEEPQPELEPEPEPEPEFEQAPEPEPILEPLPEPQELSEAEPEEQQQADTSCASASADESYPNPSPLVAAEHPQEEEYRPTASEVSENHQKILSHMISEGNADEDVHSIPCNIYIGKSLAEIFDNNLIVDKPIGSRSEGGSSPDLRAYVPKVRSVVKKFLKLFGLGAEDFLSGGKQKDEDQKEKEDSDKADDGEDGPDDKADETEKTTETTPEKKDDDAKDSEAAPEKDENDAPEPVSEATTESSNKETPPTPDAESAGSSEGSK